MWFESIFIYLAKRKDKKTEMWKSKFMLLIKPPQFLCGIHAKQRHKQKNNVIKLKWKLVQEETGE